jgi:uncharacterized protein
MSELLGTVDTLVRAIPAADRDVTKHMPPPFRDLPLGHPFGHRYVPPIDDIHPSIGKATDYGGHPSGRQAAATAVAADAQRYTDPDLAGDELFGRRGVAAAIVVAPNRLLLADWRHEVAIMRATNLWLKETWLSSRHGLAFRASIHVAPGSVRAAVEEIERWAGDPGFVQVALPLHTHEPYGDQRFFPIFEAAARQGLPVAIHGDGSGGVELAPTMAGLPAHFVEYRTLFPLNGVLQLGSMISEGVFDRLPDLTIVFTDGGFASYAPLLWREEAKAKALKEEMPWVGARPTEYLRRHVRFVLRGDDLPASATDFRTALDLADAGRTLLYGSNFPMWDMVEASPDLIPDAEIEPGFYAGTARATYPRLALEGGAQ